MRDDRASFLDDLCRFREVEPILFEGATANVGRSALVASLHARVLWPGNLPRPVRGAAKSVADQLSGQVKGTSLSETEGRFIRSTLAASNLSTKTLLAESPSDSRHADVATKVAS